MVTAFQNLTGIPLSAPMIAQLHLPVHLGGFGYLSLELISPSLYVSATIGYALFGARTIGAPTELGISSVRMQGALDMLAVKYPVLRAQVALLFQQPWNREQLCKLVDHEKWSEPIHRYQFQAMVDSSAARDRVRLLCLQNSHSGAWLNICPSAAAGLRLGNPEFNIVSRFRLGCDILPQFPRNCALCGGLVMHTGTTCCAASKMA